MNQPFYRLPLCHLALAFCLAAPAVSFAAKAVTDKIAPAISDRQDFQSPDHVHLTGWVGTRIATNENNRLVKMDVDRLLEGYRKRPGRQAWDGEHVGKWLHAATLAWVNTGDPALRQKLDYVVSELIKCQLPDGYLGTYLDKDRWTEWDVWAHKYNLIGLLTYIHYTGNTQPLPACCKMGDLLCRTFGEGPGQRDIIKAGYHKGMAPTSVLEPMVLLYRQTGDARYLDFCKYILRAWEQPNGAKIISTLLTLKRVDKVGNAKAYEMLSCLNGALEYYRITGEPRILEACQNAWQDIVKNRLYITGAASYGELFRDDFDLPNVASVGETCVTVTWLQFNAQMLRLTGEGRFAEQLEHVVLNQLLGAQKCDGSAWGYYVQMEGKKPYTSTLDGQCCLSSGPRGVALIPTFAVTTDADGVVVNLFDAGNANLKLRDGTAVGVTIATRYPAEGRITLTVNPKSKKPFALKLRVPAWCQDATMTVGNGGPMPVKAGADGYLLLHRRWAKGDQVQLDLKLEPQVVVGDHKNAGKVAVLYGPLVLAADEALLGNDLHGLSSLAVAGTNLTALNVTPEPATEAFKTWPGAQVFRINARARRATGSLAAGASTLVCLVPFADAGSTGAAYKVWLPSELAPANGNLLLDGQESRSRIGNQEGSINDGDFASFVVTFNEKRRTEDWYAVTLDEPVAVRRVLFAHGKTFHDGGWFNTAKGKPRLQVKKSAESDWETVGEFKAYPDTTATDAAGLQAGERFSCELPTPLKVCALRVLGQPASGDNPKQAFSSCAELQAYAEKE